MNQRYKNFRAYERAFNNYYRYINSNNNDVSLLVLDVFVYVFVLLVVVVRRF